MNASVQITLDEEEKGIGPYTFYKENARLESQGEEIHENRQLSIDVLNETKSKALNTWQMTIEQTLRTCTKPTAEPLGPPWTRGRYNQIEFIAMTDRWKMGP